MFRELRSLAVSVALIAFLRPRWKRLAACLTAALVVLYAHAEYLSYVAALPYGEREAHSLAWTFVAKNAALIVVVLAAAIPEVWIRARTRGKVRTPPASLTASKVRLPGFARPSDAATPAAAEPTEAGDGFDELRRKPKLKTHAEQILGRER